MAFPDDFYANEDFVKFMRQIVLQDVIKHQYGQEPEIGEREVFDAAQEFYPDDIQRKTDLIMCVMEALNRAENAGCKRGFVPKDLMREMAQKYNVEKVLDLEIALFRSSGAFILKGEGKR